MQKYILLFTSMVSLSLAMYCALVAALALIFQWSWNIVVPDVFHLRSLDYIQAVGLLSLIALVATVSKGVKLGADVKV